MSQRVHWVSPPINASDAVANPFALFMRQAACGLRDWKYSTDSWAKHVTCKACLKKMRPSEGETK